MLAMSSSGQLPKDKLKLHTLQTNQISTLESRGKQGVLLTRNNAKLSQYLLKRKLLMTSNYRVL